jgi:putative spermidine/putrescine transport system ATP-binding protein
MTVFQNIAFGLKLRRLGREAIREKVMGVLDLVGLTGFEARHPGQLSGGQQQRVAIARCVVLEPKILLMDEPFSALDAHLRVRLREEVRAIQRRLGLTTIFVTHDQEEALTLADRIVVMRAGQVEQIGTPSAIYAEPATRFVANFIGTMNMIDVTLAGGAARIGAARFHVDGPDGIYGLAVRPEDVVIDSDGPWVGIVERILDLGAFRMLDVKLDEGRLLKVQIGKSGALSAGERIPLSVRAASAFDADGNVHAAQIIAASTPLGKRKHG